MVLQDERLRKMFDEPRPSRKLSWRQSIKNDLSNLKYIRNLTIDLFFASDSSCNANIPLDIENHENTILPFHPR